MNSRILNLQFLYKFLLATFVFSFSMVALVSPFYFSADAQVNTSHGPTNLLLTTDSGAGANRPSDKLTNFNTPTFKICAPRQQYTIIYRVPAGTTSANYISNQEVISTATYIGSGTITGTSHCTQDSGRAERDITVNATLDDGEHIIFARSHQTEASVATDGIISNIETITIDTAGPTFVKATRVSDTVIHYFLSEGLRRGTSPDFATAFSETFSFDPTLAGTNTVSGFHDQANRDLKRIVITFAEAYATITSGVGKVINISFAQNNGAGPTDEAGNLIVDHSNSVVNYVPAIEAITLDQSGSHTIRVSDPNAGDTLSAEWRYVDAAENCGVRDYGDSVTGTSVTLTGSDNTARTGPVTYDGSVAANVNRHVCVKVSDSIDVAYAISTNTVEANTTPTISITTIGGESTAGTIYINATEDDSDIIISGTSTNIANTQTITLTISDTDGITADVTKTPTVTNNIWADTVTPFQMQGLAEGVITIVATHTATSTTITDTFTYDATAPTASAIATTDATTVEITLSEDVADSGTVATGDFTVSGNTVSGVTLTDARTITLTVGTAIVNGNVITIEYTGSTLADTAGNTLSIPAGSEVTNNVPAPEASTNNAPTIAEIFLSFLPAITRDHTIRVTDPNNGDGLTVHWGYVDAQATCDATGFLNGGTEVTLGGAASDNAAGREVTITYSGQANNGKFICVRVGDGTATTYGVSTAAIAGLTDTAVVSITTIGGESTTEGLVYINDAEDDGNIVVEGAVVGITNGEQISVVVDRIGSTPLEAKIATITSSGWSITISSEELKTTLGEGDVRVTATHAATTTSGQLSFTYDATAPTVINPTADQTAIVDVLFELIIPVNTFSTSTLDPTTITGNADSVSWLSYNTAERKFFGTPVVGDVGNTSSITVTGTDLAGNTVTDSFIITVVAANTTPTDITLSGATADAKSIAENITTVGTFSTTDDDGSDSHRYTLVSGTGDEDNEDFTLTEGGELSFSSIPNYEDADDSDTDNVYNIRVQTDDQNGGILAQTFIITVTDVDENDANLTNLEVDGATLAEAFGVDRVVYTSTVDSTVTSVTVTPTVSHPEATVTVAGTTVASGSASGAITLTAGADTEIVVVVTAEDASTKTYTITITRTAAPTITIATPIASDGYVNDEDDENAVTISGTSTNIGNGDTITLTISDTDGTSADVTKSTTVVAGTGGAADTWETTLTSTEMQGLAEGTITVTATYTNAADAVQTFTYDRTAPSALTLSITDTGTSSDNITSNAEVTVVGTIESNAKWEYEKNNSDDWIEGSGSSFNLTIEEQATYKVRQVDVAGNPSTESIEYTFTLDTTDPTTVGIPNQIATEKVDFLFSIPDNTFSDTNALTYTSSGHTNGITFATNTWSAAGADLTEGTVTIIATATDPAGNTGTATFTVTISPAIPAIAPFSLTTGSAYAKTETLTFTHVDNTLELEAVWFPSGENNCTEASYNSVTAADNEIPITLSGTIAENPTGRTGDITYFIPSADSATAWNNTRYVCAAVTDGTTVVTQRSTDQFSGLQKNRRPTITFTASTSYTSAKTDFELQIDVTDLDSTQGITAEYKKIDSSASCEATTTDTGETDITEQIGSTNGKTVTITFNSEDDNDKKICVTAKDTSGVPSSETGESASFPIPAASPAITGIDTTAPEAPTLSITDTGTADNDGITNNPTVTVTGVESNATWEYKEGTNNWAPGSGNTFTLTTEDEVDYKVRQTDAAGNLGAESTALSITYDATTPTTTPTISSAADDVGSIQDTLNSGDITDDTIPVFSGTVSAALGTGETVAVYEGSTLLGTTTVTGTGWTYTPTAEQNVGVKTFKAKVVDLAGNEGPFGSEFSLTIDTAAPLSPTIRLTTNSGLSTDSITNDDEITITVEQGAKVEYSLDSGTNWTEVTASAASTSVTQDLGASEGSVSVLTRQTDVAGNQSVASDEFTFTYDATTPTTTPTILSAADDVGNITDALNSGDTTDDTIPVLSGTISAALTSDETLVVYEGSTRLTTATVTGTNWTYIPTAHSGAVSFTARVVDTAGNEGAASTAFTLNIDTSIAVPSFGSGTVDNVSLLIGEPLTAVTLPASTPAGTYSIADLPDGFNFDSATRVFSGTPTTAQDTATYTYKARNSAGEATITFTITVPTPTIAITGTISDDGRINADEGAAGVVVSGTTANVFEGSDVTVSIGTYSQTVQTTDTGTWEATFSNAGGLQGLSDGDYTLTAAVTGATDATQAVSYDNTVPTITVAITHATDSEGGVRVDLNSGDTTDDDTPVFVGTISAALGTGESVAVYEGSTLLGTAIINGTVWTYTPSARAEGNKVFSAKVVDLAGNEGAFSPTFSLTIDTTTVAPSFGGATIENKSFPQSAQIAEITLPAATPVGIYEITPTIPAGLTFDPVARTISGIPSQEQLAATYTYKSSNFVGEDTIEFTITVPVSDVTFDIISNNGFVNAREDDNNLVITGTVEDLGEFAGIDITVGTLPAKDATVGDTGVWSIELTPSEIQSLTPGRVIVESVTSGVTAVSSFVYDIEGPTISSPITPSIATVDAPFTFNIPTSDFSDDYAPITYASDVSSISWLTFSKTSSTLTWSGIPPTVGTESVSLTATDAAGNSTVFTFSIETPKPVLSIDDVPGDDYINGDDVAVTISGTSTDAAVNTAVTITLGTLDSNTAQIQNDANGTWSTSFTATEVQTLTEGDVDITVSFEDADDVTKTTIYDATAPTIVSISSDDANSISITVSEDLTGTGTGFTASYGSVTDGASTDVRIVNNREIAISFSENIQRRDTITLSYSGDGLTDIAGNKLAVFSDEAVENNIRSSSGGGGGVVYVPSPSSGGGGGGAPTIPDQYVDDGDEAPVISETPTQFTRNIGLGSAGPDVRRLQQFLNSQGFLIASEGAGSAGQETEFFGPGTQRALAEYQEQNNLPATGYFGPLTRQFIQDELEDPIRPRVSSELQDQIDEIQRQIAEKQRQEELRGITEREALVESIKQQIANIEAELKRLIEEAGNTDEANRLQTSIDTREDLIDDVKRQIEEAQTRLLLAERTEPEEEETPTFVEDAVFELEVNIESIQREINALIEQANNPDSLTPEEVQDQVARREAVIDAVSQAIRAIQLEIEKRQRAEENSVENVELRNTIGDLEQKILDEEAEISKLREEINDASDDGAEDRLQGLIDTKQALIVEFRDGIREAENELLLNGKDELVAQSVYFEDILSRAKDELEALLDEEESNPTPERLAEIETEIAEKRGIIASFENSIEDINVRLSKIAALEIIEAGIKAREDQLRNTEDKEGTIADLQQRIIDIEEEIADLIEESNTPGRGGPERFEDRIQSRRNAIEGARANIEKLRGYLQEEKSGGIVEEEPADNGGLVAELKQDLLEKEEEFVEFLREVGAVGRGDEADEIYESIRARHDLIEEIKDDVKAVQEQVLLDSKDGLVAQLIYYDEFLAETTDELEALYDEEDSNPDVERLIEVKKLIAEKDKLKEFFKDSIDEIEADLARIVELEVVVAGIKAREDQLRNTEDKEGLISTLEQKILDIDKEVRDLIEEGKREGSGGIERFANDIESRLNTITDTKDTIEKLRAYLEEERNGN